MTNVHSIFSRGIGWLTRSANILPARLLAENFVHDIEHATDTPFNLPPTQGYMRGIDYYSREDLIKSITRTNVLYKHISGSFPNLLEPRYYTEKLNRAKFLSKIKVPESGNKLLTDKFIPDPIRGVVSCPTIVWHSKQPSLPFNSEISPGEYYLKASHGSGMFRRIRFPLGESERASLEQECRTWLISTCGLSIGEWWYNVFEPEVLIEECISSRNPSISLMFEVLAGKVRIITAYEKKPHGVPSDRMAFFDAGFSLLPFQLKGAGRLPECCVPPKLQAQTLEIASVIGQNFGAVRVDLIISDDGLVYLNEITIMIAGGFPALQLKNRALDLQMGEEWKGCEIFAEPGTAV